MGMRAVAKILVALCLLECAPPAQSAPPARALTEDEGPIPLVVAEVVEAVAKKVPRPLSRRAELISDGRYLVPPAQVVSLLERQAPPEVAFHARSRMLVRSYHQQLIPSEQKERPYLSLAGLRIDAKNLTNVEQTYSTHLRVSPIDAPLDVKQLAPPEGALFGEVVFAPGGERFLVSVVHPDRLAVAIYDFTTAQLRELPTPALSGVWGPPCQWLSDEDLVCMAAVQTELSDHPPRGPSIQELKSGAAPIRTYSDLLQSVKDDYLFERHGQVELFVIDVEFEMMTESPVSGVLRSVSVSPDKKYVAAARIVRPYSRLLPASRFPTELVVFELETGEQVYRVPIRSEETTTGTALGARLPIWNPAVGAELIYVDRSLSPAGGARDRLCRLSFPEAQLEVVSDSLHRVLHLDFTSRGRLVLTDARSERSFSSYGVTSELVPLASGTTDDVAGDLSRALRLHGSNGPLLEVADSFFFVNETASDSQSYQELVRYNPKTAQRGVLWKSQGREHVEFYGVLDVEKKEFLFSRETAFVPPGVYLSEGGKRKNVAKPHPPYPELEGVSRRPLRIRRPDGVIMSSVLCLPVGFKQGTPVPTVLWIYPKEFENAEQVESSILPQDSYFEVHGPSRFALLTQGYALLDLPAVPIVGDVKTGRDDFLPQLVSSTEAAIDKLLQLGVARRDDVYVMGRSFGAFAVANLLAHSKMFRTGIAMSGAYNRTLTPFGFQFETRSFWQNTEAYVNLSPFFFADQVRGSLLLIHGEVDENPGTPVLQSERFYAALVGNGVRVRYVALPFEGHRYRGRDGVLHVAAEMLRWLDAARPGTTAR